MRRLIPRKAQMMVRKSKKLLASYEEAYDFALDRLSVRDYSTKDMEGKLRERNCPSALITQVIAKLLENKFIDEERYGQRVYEYWLTKKFYGRQHLRMTLMKKKVRSDLISGLVKQLTHAEEEKRAEAYTDSNLPKFRKKYGEETQKIAGALARGLGSRGFSTEIISIMLGRARCSE